jgi:D-alanyl-D-alanine carboxypeptidase
MNGCTNTGTTNAPTRPAPPYNWADPQLGARLDEALRLWTEDFGIYGAAAAVRTPQWFNWTGSTGEDDIETHAPYRVDNIARIGSATKPFTSTLVLQLVDEGLLSLDATLSQFVPDYPNGENITVEHLLRHRSGIPEIQLVDRFFILTLLLVPENWFTPEDILVWTYLPIPIWELRTGVFVPREPSGPPGGDFHYSQPGYVALGHIVEKITGKALADVYDERIIRPIGLTGTHFPVKDEPLYPSGYTNLFGLLDDKVPGSSLVDSANGLNSSGGSAGGMISTAGDLVTFLSGMLEGRLLSGDALAYATDWMEIEPGDVVEDGEYGMGLFRFEREGTTTIGHGGSLPSGGSVMQYIPDLDVYICAVRNTDMDRAEAPGFVERVRRALLNEPADEEP